MNNQNISLTNHPFGTGNREYYNSNIRHKILVTPNGPSLYSSQAIGTNTPDIIDWFGQACFSPDGAKFALALARTQSVELFDFDRCTGELSNPQFIFINDSTAGLLGCSFSSNSRFLYTSSDTYIYQIDSWSPNVDSSKQVVAVYDGYVGNFQTKFFYHQLAADGKIYICTVNGDSVIHTINQPNLMGINCDVHQHSVKLSYVNNISLNNFPNYQLGPLTGSFCDSLTAFNSIKNHNNLYFDVSPNPSGGNNVNIKYILEPNKNGLVEITDVNGQLVQTTFLPQWSSTQELIVSDLVTGVYIFRLRSGSKDAFCKFIKL